MIHSPIHSIPTMTVHSLLHFDTSISFIPTTVLYVLFHSSIHSTTTDDDVDDTFFDSFVVHSIRYIRYDTLSIRWYVPTFDTFHIVIPTICWWPVWFLTTIPLPTYIHIPFLRWYDGIHSTIRYISFVPTLLITFDDDTFPFIVTVFYIHRRSDTFDTICHLFVFDVRCLLFYHLSWLHDDTFTVPFCCSIIRYKFCCSVLLHLSYVIFVHSYILQFIRWSTDTICSFISRYCWARYIFTFTIPTTYHSDTLFVHCLHHSFILRSSFILHLPFIHLMISFYIRYIPTLFYRYILHSMFTWWSFHFLLFVVRAFRLFICSHLMISSFPFIHSCCSFCCSRPMHSTHHYMRHSVIHFTHSFYIPFSSFWWCSTFSFHICPVHFVHSILPTFTIRCDTARPTTDRVLFDIIHIHRYIPFHSYIHSHFIYSPTILFHIRYSDVTFWFDTYVVRSWSIHSLTIRYSTRFDDLHCSFSFCYLMLLFIHSYRYTVPYIPTPIPTTLIIDTTVFDTFIRYSPRYDLRYIHSFLLTILMMIHLFIRWWYHFILFHSCWLRFVRYILIPVHYSYHVDRYIDLLFIRYDDTIPTYDIRFTRWLLTTFVTVMVHSLHSTFVDTFLLFPFHSFIRHLVLFSLFILTCLFTYSMTIVLMTVHLLLFHSVTLLFIPVLIHSIRHSIHFILHSTFPDLDVVRCSSWLTWHIILFYLIFYFIIPYIVIWPLIFSDPDLFICCSFWLTDLHWPIFDTSIRYSYDVPHSLTTFIPSPFRYTPHLPPLPIYHSYTFVHFDGGYIHIPFPIILGTVWWSLFDDDRDPTDDHLLPTFYSFDIHSLFCWTTVRWYWSYHSTVLWYIRYHLRCSFVTICSPCSIHSICSPLTYHCCYDAIPVRWRGLYFIHSIR